MLVAPAQPTAPTPSPSLPELVAPPPAPAPKTAPRPAGETFGGVQAAKAAVVDARAPATGVFSAAAASAGRLQVEQPPRASAGFGSARVGETDGKPAPPARAGSAFGSAQATASAATPATKQSVPGGFGAARSTGSDAPNLAVAQAGFGAASAQAPTASAPKRSAPQASLEPVRILSKPDPLYTEEARSLRIEGDVLVAALFTADGRIEELRVVRGLGHGLDEAALAAARRIEFEPARREGDPVDARLQLTVRFQLAY